MRLTGQDIQYVSSVTHDGKVVVLGTATDGTIYYSVKRSGFEPSALVPDADPFGFEEWTPLPLSLSKDDPSVREHEQKVLTDGAGAPILRSLYGDSDQVTRCAQGPVYVVSALEHLWVFRRSYVSQKILVNRFVLDGDKNVLAPKLEVRFARSRQRLHALTPVNVKPGAKTTFDTLDYRDIEGEHFFEPAVELSFIGGVKGLSPLFVPTAESDRARWHLFVRDSADKIVLYTVGARADGTFDPGDYLLSTLDSEAPENSTHRSIAGLIRRTLSLKVKSGSGGNITSSDLTVAGDPTSTLYNIQREQITDSGPQLMAGEMRVMLAVPVRRGTAAPSTLVLDFALATDGTLSQIEESPDANNPLTSNEREVQTPLSLLDHIKEMAQADVAGGTVAATERGEDDALMVRWTAAPSTAVEAGSRVKLRGTQSYDGHYLVKKVHSDGFEVEATFRNNEAGFWEVVPQAETGLIFDNMIVGTEKVRNPVSDGGTLKILCPSHDLAFGNEVQISGTREYDGIYPVVSVDDGGQGFVLDAPYFTGEAANLTTVIRRGIRMGNTGLVTAPDFTPPSPGLKSFGRTLSAWVKVKEESTTEQVLVQDSQGMALILGKDNRVRFDVAMGNNRVESVRDPSAPTLGEWTHFSGTVDYQASTCKSHMQLIRGGEKKQEEDVSQRPRLAPAKPRPYAVFDGKDDHINVAGVWALMKPPFTVTCRVTLHAQHWSSTQTLLLCSSSSTGLVLQYTDQLWLMLPYPGTMMRPSCGSLVIGKQYLITVSVASSGNITVYVDNKATNVQLPYAQPASNTNMILGSSSVSNNLLNGALSEVSVWNRSLSAAEVAALVGGEIKGTEPNLVGYWPLHQDATDHSAGGRHGQIFSEPRFVTPPQPTPGFVIGKDFKGEIADAQLWSITRSPAEIKASMYLTPSGIERGLEVCYRLGGLVYGDGKVLAPDLSQYHRDALVTGDAYTGSRQLNRATTVEKKKVTRYASDELVTVSQRGTYDESFEFRLSPDSAQIDPQNADGTGQPLFTFSHWGKVSRGSDEKIKFTGQTSRFESLGQGWYRAHCRVVVPDGVSVMRAFEIADVKGRWGNEVQPPANEWEEMEIRNHHIRLVSDSITCQDFAEDISVGVVSGLSQDAQNTLASVARAEAKIASYEMEIADLLRRIAVVDNLQAYQAEKVVLLQEIDTLKKKIDATQAEITRIDTDPYSYWHALQAKHSNYYVTHNNNDDYIFQWNKPSAGFGTDQQWAIEREAGGFYSFHHRMRSTRMSLSKSRADMTGVRYTGDSERWSLIADGAYYRLYNKAVKEYADVWGESSHAGTHLVGYQYSGKSNQLFLLQKLEGKTTFAEREHQARQEELALQLAELKRLNDRLAELDAILSTQEDRATLVRRQEAASTSLTSERQSLASFYTALSPALVPGNAVEMPTLTTDGRQLKTAGCLLESAMPDGDLSLTASGNGNVLLTCFDAQGRVRVNTYDPVADSENSTFEQWLPDGLRPCADVRDTGDVIEIGTPPHLPVDGWSCEVWVQYPFATQKAASASAGNGSPLDRNVVVAMGGSSSDPLKDAPLVIRNGNRLGLVAGGWFFDSGVDLDQELCADWHHLAATWSVATLRFYADGVLIASRAASQSALQFDGSRDHLQVPAHSGPASRFSISVWARSPGVNWSGSGSLVHKEQVFKLAPSGTRGITFTVWVKPSGGSAAEKSATYTLPSSIDLRDWHLFTGVFDGEYLSVYADGRLLGTKVGAVGTPKTDSAQMFIATHTGVANSAHLQVELTEVSYWGRALGPDSIRDLWNGKVLTGAEEGLVHLWRMAAVGDQTQGRTVPDLVSTSKQDAKVGGSPKDLVMAPFSDNAVKFLGNNSAGDSPVGRLAEVRLWDVALSDAEIAANACLSLSGNEPRLLAWWPLAEVDPTAKVGDASYGGVADGRRKAVDAVACTAALGNPGTGVLSLPEPGGSYLKGANLSLGNASFTVEFWARRRRPEGSQYVITLGTRAGNHGLNFGYYASNNSFGFGFWEDDCRSGTTETDTAWHHWCGTFDMATMVQKLYRDGVLLTTRTASGRLLQSDSPLFIGGAFGGADFLRGDVAEVRVWDTARTGAEIAQTMRRRLSGQEPGLITCYPLDEADLTGAFLNKATGKWDALPTGGVRVAISTSLRLASGERVTASEYATTQLDRDGQKHSVLRRSMVWCSGGDARLLSEQRVDSLTLQWVGNTQIEPTLIGYIEGPPPVPSENLTESEDGYRGATSVSLSQSEDVSYGFGRSESYAAGVDSSYFSGVAWETEASVIGLVQKMTEGEMGGVGKYAFKTTWAQNSNITSTSSLQTSDTLLLTGMFEDKPMSRALGRRWLPKNVGYALVLSGAADVFVTRLRRSGRMIGYQVIPVEGIPLDVNTLTFMINPAYCLGGSLDGLVGSMAADPVFYGHVPEMRAQYGSAYPASYFQVNHAYELKRTIDRQDKERASFFENFDTTSLGGVVPPPEDSDLEIPPTSSPEATEEEQQQALETQGAQAQQLESDVEARMSEIDKMLTTSEDKERASAAFTQWQRNMETVLVRAGKRNIVNTYVWDADGGLRAEEQSFASTIEHSVNTDWSWSAGGGAEMDLMACAVKAKMSIVGFAEGEGSTSKTLGTGKALGLTVDLSGVEGDGVTDLRDNPRKPGEKVGRYRFLSFYLEGSTGHFNDFFRQVVDPEWLQSNSEEARALRQAMAKPTRTWRVLHRVTYVERPALKNFSG